MIFCPNCGFQKEFCICSLDVDTGEARKETILYLTVQDRRFSKEAIVIKPVEKNESAKRLVKQLRKAFQTGGTLKNGAIELRLGGQNLDEVAKFLRNEGFKVKIQVD